MTADWWLLIAVCWLLSADCWLLSADCWLLIADCWLLTSPLWWLQLLSVRHVCPDSSAPLASVTEINAADARLATSSVISTSAAEVRPWYHHTQTNSVRMYQLVSPILTALYGQVCSSTIDCFDAAASCLGGRCGCSLGYEYNQIIERCNGESVLISP